MLYTDDPQAFIDECLAVCNNYVKTGQSIKTMKILDVLKKIVPDHPMVEKFASGLDLSGGGASIVFEVKGADDFFGKDWQGEDLTGKSIEVFVDQGAGDVIMLLRYLQEMKNRWDCRIALNCYSHYGLLYDLLNGMDSCFERITNKHIICDYQTNLFSVPALLNGLKVYYPANFAELLEIPIPEQPMFRSNIPAPSTIKKIGIAWESNPENEKLYRKKSLSLESFRSLKGDMEFISLLPGKTGLDFIDERRNLESLGDTAKIIATLDAVVSVDTVTLHLAGSMGKTTFGLLSCDADVRWGTANVTPWYPSVKLFRQVTEGSWKEPLEELAKALEEV